MIVVNLKDVCRDNDHVQIWIENEFKHFTGKWSKVPSYYLTANIISIKHTFTGLLIYAVK